MHFTKNLIVVASCATAAFAKNINVAVGQNGGLTFEPASVEANVGDNVVYTFMTQNHTVTSGNPNVACNPSGGNNQINSGFLPVKQGQTSNLPTFTVPIKNTKPITLYCAQAKHCQSGMVMVINPTESGPTSLVQYQRLVSQVNVNIPANGISGGTVGKGGKIASQRKRSAMTHIQI